MGGQEQESRGRNTSAPGHLPVNPDTGFLPFRHRRDLRCHPQFNRRQSGGHHSNLHKHVMEHSVRGVRGGQGDPPGLHRPPQRRTREQLAEDKVALHTGVPESHRLQHADLLGCRPLLPDRQRDNRCRHGPVGEASPHTLWHRRRRKPVRLRRLRRLRPSHRWHSGGGDHLAIPIPEGIRALV